MLGTTLTFSEAPSTGTNNVYVIYRDQPVGSLIDTGAVRKSGDTMTNTLRLPGIETAGSPSLLFGASKWMTQYEDTLARTYICGPDSSNYAAWEIYRATAAGSPILTMKLDSSGRVTMPYQPAASVSYSGADVPTGNIIPLTTTPIVRGGMSISSNRITVPVGGTYVVGYHHLATSNGVQVVTRVNGAPINSGAGACTQGHAASPHHNFSVQNLVNLVAGDYIEFWCVGGSGPVHGNSGYNRMYLYLLG